MTTLSIMNKIAVIQRVMEKIGGREFNPKAIQFTPRQPIRHYNYNINQFDRSPALSGASQGNIRPPIPGPKLSLLERNPNLLKNTAKVTGGLTGAALASGTLYGAYVLTQSDNPELQQAGLETLKATEEAQTALDAAQKSGDKDALAAANKLAEQAKSKLLATQKLVAEQGKYEDLVKATGFGDIGQGALSGLGEPLITTPVGAGIGYGISELTDTNPLLGGGIGAIAGAVTPNIADFALRKYLGS